MKINKTNAARILDSKKINYELVPYTVDESDLDATHVAAELGEDIAQVFKTLVLRGDRNGLLVCVIPGDKEVDLKKAAKLSGNKKVEMIAMKELLPLTGYIRGGMDFPFIYISAGVRGLQLKIAPQDLLDVTGSVVADLIAE